MIICPACRAKNPTGAKVCASCEAELVPRGATASSKPAGIPEQQNDHRSETAEPDAALVAELLSNPGNAPPAPVVPMPEGVLRPAGPNPEEVLASLLNRDEAARDQLIPLPDPSDIPLPEPGVASRADTGEIKLPEMNSADDEPLLEPIEEDDSIEGELILDGVIVDDPVAISADESTNLPVLSSSDRIPTNLPVLSSSDRIPTVKSSAAERAARQAEEEASLERDSRGGQWLTLPDEGDEPVFLQGDKEKSPPPTMPAAGSSDAWQAVARDVGPIEAKRLPPAPDVPEITKALTATDSIVGSISYAIHSRKIVAAQREAQRALGAALAKLKRQERQCIEALGRAARVNNLIPIEMRDAADAANLEESAAQQRRERADATQQEQAEAERKYQAIKKNGEERLAKLEEKHAPLLARRQEMQRRLRKTEEELEQATSREQELLQRAQTPPTEEELGGEIRMEGERIVVSQRSPDEEIAARKEEHRQALTHLDLLTKRRALLHRNIAATQKPLEQLEAHMKKVRAAIHDALEEAQRAQGQAKVAVVAGQRRAAFANRSAAELDREIGKAVLGLSEPPIAFDRLIESVETCRKRIAKVAELVNHQQDQLELHDEDQAKRGWRWLIVFVVVSAVAVGLLISLAGSMLS